MLCHGLLYVGKGNLPFIQEQIDKHEPDSWKGYNISNSAKVDDDPNSLMRQWRHDDEEVAYPTFELIQKNYDRLKGKKPGFNNICVHKGLAPGPPDPSAATRTTCPGGARLAEAQLHHLSRLHPAELLPGRHAGGGEGGQAPRRRAEHRWTTEYAQLVRDLPNCYAEIGTTWASSVVTFPTIAAHILGQLLKFMGEDRIVFGSDSVWYGSPQWQIEALWRFQIPEELRQKYGYPELTEQAKRKILGLTSARLYKMPARGLAAGDASGGVYRPLPRDYENRIPVPLKALLEYPGLPQDKLAQARREYLQAGAMPSHTRYGWVHAG